MQLVCFFWKWLIHANMTAKYSRVPRNTSLGKLPVQFVLSEEVPRGEGVAFKDAILSRRTMSF